MLRSRILGSLLMGAAAWLPCTTAASEAPLTAAERRAVVEDLGRTLAANYVFPEKAATIAATLRAHLDKGDYDDAGDKTALASELTRDLIAASNDLHFFVGVDPAFVTDFAAKRDPLQYAALRDRERQAEQRGNFGFTDLRILDGNVAYVGLSHFADPELGYDAAAATMRFIENSDAVIYDLRYNNGGALEMAQLLASQLFRGDKDQELFDYYYSDDGKRIERGQWVLPALPAKRLTGKPVYILTASTSFSAAEWFAYSLRKLGRATIVGERTAGGAHPVDRKPVGNDFFVQVPIGQIKDPVDRGDFEGQGVMPDHAVASADALAVAHRLALADIARADPAKKAEADWLAPLFAAPAKIAPAELKAVTGRYEGRRIDLADGKLLYTWRDRFRLQLQPLGGDLFALEGVRDFRFRILRKAGKVVTLQRIDRDGTTTDYARLD
ncbi:MAG: S41 family peptidase [Sphingomonadales bacterium]|nr:S41 family peptidase [Sphingomonadales bacterium]